MSHTQHRLDRDRDRRQARDRRDADRRGRCGTSMAVKRVGWTLAACGAVALVVSLTTSTGPKRPPPPEHLGGISPKRVTEHVADTAIVGAALAAERAAAARDGAPDPRRVPVGHNPATRVESQAIRLTAVRSRDAHLTIDAAKADAVEQARDQLATRLLRLDSPITRLPSAETVRDSYVKSGEVRTIQPDEGLKAEWVKAKLEPGRVWVEVDVEVTPKQLQQLRGEERTVGVARVVGAIVLVLVGVAGFFRLDTLTKGHLTPALGVGVAALGAAGVAAAVYFARGG